ncbi:MAG: asparagine synthase (glutamine-hydrolyzing) [Marinilabiliaceae bacterium]|nr:asparagine synthase (glutamine-hydrolyzing) [Marinilabiliaceae bacterium]
MCGINGIYKYNKITTEDITKIELMNQGMLYRGPDEQDIWHNELVAIGHVRLSIIALNNGHQPLFNENKSISLVCNGEIYNHYELRVSLLALGHKFSTESDCEVILHLYEEYGEKLFDYLNGMFAFALFDSKNNKLLLGRDRLGKKPLYYCNTPKGLVFSSEIKAIKNNWIPYPQINHNIINQIIERSFSLSPNETYIKSINKLKPGCFIVTNSDQIIEKQYWKREITNTYTDSYSKAKDDILKYIEDAVKIRLESEVPMAVLLSGGIDSTTIAHFAKKHKSDIKAITLGYKGDHDCDESYLAERFAKEKSIELIKLELDENDYESYLHEFLPILDEPNGDIATFAQWGLYKKSKELGFKVLLSGNGGDELFFGYPSYNHTAIKIELLNKFYKKYLPIFSYKAFAKLLLGLIKENRLIRNFKPELNIEPFYNSVFNAEDGTPLITPNSYFNSNINIQDSIYEFVFNIWLTNNCFQLSDKLGMGNTIEIRSPFADINLIEFVHSLPLSYRFNEFTQKKLLRDSLVNIIPDFILNQPKRGFTPPVSFVDNILPKQYTHNNKYPFPYAKFTTEYFINSKY